MDTIYSTSAGDSGQGQPVFACNLLALTPEERRAHAEVTARLGQEVIQVRELPDGYAFGLRPEAETIRQLAQFVTNERLCCPFFTFTIRVEPGGGPVWLHLTGPEGIKPFIQAEFTWSA